jgi:uncharacterized membrane protein YphA (DoxX/SURF4 family)
MSNTPLLYPPPRPATSDTLLKWTATLIVAATFLLAGAGKVASPSGALSLVDRYLSSAQSVRAVGLIEIGLALWLVSGRTPGWAAAFAGLSLAGFTGLIAVELSRTQPLPCGCLPTTPGAMDPFAVRKGLWIGIGRNVFLIALCGVSAWLAQPFKPSSDLLGRK